MLIYEDVKRPKLRCRVQVALIETLSEAIEFVTLKYLTAAMKSLQVSSEAAMPAVFMFLLAQPIGYGSSTDKTAHKLVHSLSSGIATKCNINKTHEIECSFCAYMHGWTRACIHA